MQAEIDALQSENLALNCEVNELNAANESLSVKIEDLSSRNQFLSDENAKLYEKVPFHLILLLSSFSCLNSHIPNNFYLQILVAREKWRGRQ